VAHPKAMALPTEVLLQLNTLALAHRKASVPILWDLDKCPKKGPEIDTFRT